MTYRPLWDTLSARGVPTRRISRSDDSNPPETAKRYKLPAGWQDSKHRNPAEAFFADVERLGTEKGYIAVLGGRLDGGGVDVIDVDPRNGGLDSWSRLITDRRLADDVLAWQTTPGGGFHVFVPSLNLGKKTNLPGYPGIDYLSGLAEPDERGKTHRAFVFLAPTMGVNRQTGEQARYEAVDWTERLREGERALGKHAERVLDCIRGIFEAERAAKAQSAPSAPASRQRKLTFTEALDDARIDGALDKLREAPEGERNNTLNETAYTVFAALYGKEAPSDAFDVATDTLASIAGDIGLEPDEIVKTIESATAGAQRNPMPDRPLHPDPVGDFGIAPSEAEEERFWASSEALTRVRTLARANRASPWATLGVLLSRIAATVPPGLKAPGLTEHGPGTSLNFYSAIVAPTGIGKGAAEAAAGGFFSRPKDQVGMVGAEDDFDHPNARADQLGTGEGLAAMYVRYVKASKEQVEAGEPAGQWEQYSTRRLVVSSEISELESKGGRRGSNLQPVLLVANDGGALGDGNATEELRRQVSEGAYRLALVVHAQPEKMGWLLDGSSAGLPGRFTLFGATDGGALRRGERPAPPEPVEWSPPWGVKHLPPDGQVMVQPETAWQYLDDVLVAKHRREAGEPLGDLAHLEKDPMVTDSALSQAPRQLVRIQCLLALLDGTLECTEQHFEMARLVVRKSAAVLEGVRRTMGRDAAQAAHARGRLDAVRDEAKNEESDERMAREHDRVLKLVGREWTKRREIRAPFKGSRRELADRILDQLVQDGEVEVREVQARGNATQEYRRVLQV